MQIKDSMLKGKGLIIDVLILLVIPLFYLFLHVFSLRFSFMFNDNLLHFAHAYNVIQIIADGEFPLRDPYLYIDLLRTGISSILYWPNVLFTLIGVRFFAGSVEPLRILWIGMHFLHICLPAFGMYFLLRYCKFSRLPCILGSLVYGWNLHMTIMAGIYTAYQRAIHLAVIPLVSLIAMYSLDAKKYYLNILSGLLISWAILAGGLQPVIYIIPFLLLYLFVRLLCESPFSSKGVFRAIFIPALIIVSIILCILPQLLTGSDIFPYLNRGHQEAQNILPLFSTGEFFFSLLEPFSQWNRMERLPWETISYFGFTAIFLFIVGMGVALRDMLLRRKNTTEKWFLFILITTFVVSVGYAYFPEMLLRLLLFQKGITRNPFRIFAVCMFAVSFFAASGLQYLRDRDFKREGIAKLLLGIALVVGISAFLFKMLNHNPVLGGKTFFIFNSAVSLLSLLGFTFVYFKPKYSSLLIVLIIFDLSLVGYVYCDNRLLAYGYFIKKDFYKQAFLRIQDKDWIPRLPKSDIPYRTIIYPPFGEIARDTETGYVYHKLRYPFGYCGSIGINRIERFKRIRDFSHPIFDILGVRFFAVNKKRLNVPIKDDTPGNSYLLSNRDYLPLIYARNKVRFFQDTSEVLEAVYQGNDEMKSAVYFSLKDLGDDAHLFNPFLNPEYSIEPIIKEGSLIYKSSKIEFSIDSSQEAVCVLSEPWLPPWRASIDGEQVKIYQAYGLIQAILLPRGSHKVRFEYTFPIYLIYISALSQIAILIFVWLSLKRKKE